MPRRQAIFSAAATTVAVLFATSGVAHGDIVDSAKADDAVPGELIVAYTARADRGGARAAAKVRAVRNMLVPNFQLVKTDGTSVAEAIRRLEARSDVRYAVRNYIHTATATTNDTRFGELWGLQNTGQLINNVAGTPNADSAVTSAWDVFTGNPETVVAVVDTGVAYDHPDLAANIWTGPSGEHGKDFVDNDNDPRDLQLHGTHVAGTIAAVGNNATGITGVTQRAKIMGVRVLNAQGSGTLQGILDGFEYAGAMGARVANASLGGGGDAQSAQAYGQVVGRHPNTLYVVAAGNEANNNDGGAPANARYPCNAPGANLICVAATDNKDALASFSNFGITQVDLGAPGVDTLSTVPARQTVFADGFEDAGSFASTWTTQGTWARSSESSASGSFGLNDSPGELYADESTTLAFTQDTVNLAGKDACTMKFKLRLDTERDGDTLFDKFHVVTAPPGGNFTPIRTLGGTTNGGYATVDVPLLSTSVHVGFALETDEFVQDDGAVVDDLVVSCISTTYGTNDYGYSSGTSMASPHVAGAATLIIGSRPGATVAQVRDWLLNSGDSIPALAGKTVTGKRLDVAAALRASDGVAPDTTIDSGPSGVINTSTAAFGFSSEPGATFECKLDAGAFEACTSPRTYGGLPDGAHTFSVRAKDAAGNVDPSEATRGFTIDTRPPTTPPPPPPGGGGTGSGGTGGGGTGGDPTTDKAGPRLTVPSAKTFTASATGVFNLRLGKASEDGTGTVSLKTDGKVQIAAKKVLGLGVKSFQLLAGEDTIVRMKLAAKAKKTLVKRKKLKVIATITMRDALGNPTVQTYKFTLKAPKKKRR